MSELGFEGFNYIVLMFAEANAPLSKAELIDGVACEFSDKSDLLDAFGNIEIEGLIKVAPSNYISVTGKGRKWLQEHSMSTSVEGDERQNEGAPKHPYDVAKLKMETKPLSVFQALRKIERGQIDISPDFQRAFVWDEVKQSRLVESMLIRIPLPAFYLDATEQTQWRVVDGLQRLTTLKRFCRDESFSLKGLEFLTDLSDLKFSELPQKYQVLLEDETTLLFYNLMPGTPDQAKYTIFSRVNTGGMQLTPQEIRHALNQGVITDALGSVVRTREFLDATQGVVESKRMTDRELSLRAMAFMRYGIDLYKECGDMESFLMISMGKFNKLSETEVKCVLTEYCSSLEKVFSIFGRYSFRKFYERKGRRSPLNKALFDAWVCEVARYSHDQLLEAKGRILDEYLILMNHDEDFLKSITASTSGVGAVDRRFSRIRDLLERATHDQ